MNKTIRLFDISTITQGIVAGLLMALFLITLSVTGEYGTSALKFAKYIILLGAVGVGLTIVRERVGKPEFLVHSLKKGLIISFLGGMVVTIANTIAFFIKPSYGIAKYNLVPETVAQLHMVNAAMMVEVIVIGMVGTFILYQGLKR